MTTRCKYPECERKHYAKGFCHSHYQQQRCGKALAPIWRSMSRTVQERFDFFTEVGPDGCLNWLGYRNGAGYGTIQIKGRSTLAHRLAWEMANGPIPKDLTIDHLCFNPACVNVGHLRLLTKSENSGLRRNVGKGSCIHGHEFTADNTYLNRVGARICRTCQRDRRMGASA